MANEIIMLAKTYKAGKAKFPAYVSEKYDGVAADLQVVEHTTKKGKSLTTLALMSRQGEVIKSCFHIVKQFAHEESYMPLRKGMHFIGELYIPGMDFKDISGLVRRDEADEETANIQFHIYDFYEEGKESDEYHYRMEHLESILEDTRFAHIFTMEQHYVTTHEELEATAKTIVLENKSQRPTGSEGVCVRQLTGKGSGYEIAKRPSGFLKWKLTETIDLPCHSVEEAIDAKTGKGLGMVGRINVVYRGKVTGIGPGKLTHKERVEIFNNFENYRGKMLEAAYMPDDSYEGLREGRFYAWRPDKD